MLAGVSAPLLAEDAVTSDQPSAADVQKGHVEYRRDLAKQERSLAAAFKATGQSRLSNKHLTLAAHHEAMAADYEKAVVAK